MLIGSVIFAPGCSERSTLLSSGMVLIAGGEEVEISVVRLDPESDNLTVTGGLKVARANHCHTPEPPPPNSIVSSSSYDERNSVLEALDVLNVCGSPLEAFGRPRSP